MTQSVLTTRLALPKGSMEKSVFELLKDAGIRVQTSDRGYRPDISLPGIEVKILRPQNIVKMLELGSRDMGFAGADWVAEHQANLEELLDTELDPVRIVVAAPETILENGKLPGRRLVVASEYQNLAREWVRKNKLDATLVFSYGATEVFPPEDADVILDNTATGSTLKANGLVIIDEIMRSSTRLYANADAFRNGVKREHMDRLVLLLKSVLEARKRVMVEVNVPEESLSAVIEVLPCMREPTMSPLHGGGGYAVKAAVPRQQLAAVIPEIKSRGGTDIVVTKPAQIVP